MLNETFSVMLNRKIPDVFIFLRFMEIALVPIDLKTISSKCSFFCLTKAFVINHFLSVLQFARISEALPSNVIYRRAAEENPIVDLVE